MNRSSARSFGLPTLSGLALALLVASPSARAAPHGPPPSDNAAEAPSAAAKKGADLSLDDSKPEKKSKSKKSKHESAQNGEREEKGDKADKSDEKSSRKGHHRHGKSSSASSDERKDEKRAPAEDGATIVIRPPPAELPLIAPAEVAAAHKAPAAPTPVKDSLVVPYQVPAQSPSEGSPVVVAPTDATALAAEEAEEEEITKTAGLGRLKIDHASETGKYFVLEQIEYLLNGHRIFPDPEKPVDITHDQFPVWEGVLPVGENEITVTAVYRGVGKFPFTYLNDMKFKKTDTQKVTVAEGAETTVQVAGREDPSMVMEMADRLSFTFTSHSASLKTTAQK